MHNAPPTASVALGEVGTAEFLYSESVTAQSAGKRVTLEGRIKEAIVEIIVTMGLKKLLPRGTNTLSRPANTAPATDGCSFLGTPVGRSASRPRVAATFREGVDRKRGQPMLALVVTAKDVPESLFGVLRGGLFETFHSQILDRKAAGDAGQRPGSR